MESMQSFGRPDITRIVTLDAGYATNVIPDVVYAKRLISDPVYASMRFPMQSMQTLRFPMYEAFRINATSPVTFGMPHT